MRWIFALVLSALPMGAFAQDDWQADFRLAVSACWNVGALSAADQEIGVTLALEMDADGRPVTDTIRMIESTASDDAAAQSAFQVARRAVIRCAGQGYDLPADQFDLWRQMELTFDPREMAF